ncbi:acetylornithine deacetylase [Prauserella sediminis]|uniref:Acetylornithine deacetylase n=1 Tax=Prauserella sediminis TaxID=577680 RepID=A0A839XSV3_9PSEU|nr:M20/M25/M40 family metallo-hydrolase [Prauserella sediminis]MBB3664514.1 acetylornithine deacetylase [Prauserella sediminis]
MISDAHEVSVRDGSLVLDRGRREALMEFLAETVRRVSVSGEEDRVIDVYEDFFLSRGWPVRRDRLADSSSAGDEVRAEERANLVGYYRTRRPDRPVVVINGHMDVVPVLDGDQWDREPYSGDRSCGFVHGRGTVDTKGGIAAALWALDLIDRSGAELPFDVAVELVVGEETTGVGTRAALERLPRRLGTIVLEPTDGAVVTVASGLVFFTVEVLGRAAHTSVPWHGVDVGPRIIDIYQALTRLGEQRAAEQTDARMPFPSAVPLAMGTVEIGGWRAAVPARGRLSGRIGIMPGESVDDVRAALAECVASVAAADPWMVEHPPVVRWDNEGLASWETPESDHVVVAMDRGRRFAGLEPRIEGMTAGCDAGILRSAGVPTVVFGPGDMRFAHSPDERIAESDVAEATQVLAQALLAWGDLAEEQR